MILSVDATHLLMASEDSDVVGMKAVPQTPQGPRRLTCVFYKQSTKYSSSAADTLKLYDHIPGSRCPFDIWHKHGRGMNTGKGAELQPQHRP